MGETSDLDDLKALLDRWHVPYDVAQVVLGRIDKEAPGLELTVRQGSETVTGYTGFITVFDFTPDGRFLRMGAWE